MLHHDLPQHAHLVSSVALQVRKGAVEAVLGLTATADGQRLLAGSKIAAQLRRLAGDLPVIAGPAITAMINLSADAAMLEQLLREGMVSSLMESLRDEDCPHRRLIVMLLTNLSGTGEGVTQLLQKADAGGGLVGLHLRRLIQWFVTPLKGPAAATAAARAARTGDDDGDGDEGDTFEHVGCILANATQDRDARRIIMEPERGILAALLPQLRSPSRLRRRGVAGALRNCAFDIDIEEGEGRYLKHLLAPSVDLVTALLLPLAGPAEYRPEEVVGMHEALARAGPRKRREPDAPTRRALVETLLLLCCSRAGREHLRSVRAYIVIRAFHRWLESDERLAEIGLGPRRHAHDLAPEAAGGAGGAGAGAGTSAGAAAAAAAEAVSKGAAAGVLVTSRGGGGKGKARGEDEDADAGDDDDPPLPVDDEATVAAINMVVEQLFRDDEVRHTGEVTGVFTAAPAPAPAAAASALSDGAAGGAGAGAGAGAGTPALASGAAAAKAAGAVPEPRARPGQTLVPEAEAKAKAAAVSRGADVGEEELGGLVTAVPDWTEEDPELPAAFAKEFEAAKAQAAKDARDRQSGASAAAPAPVREETAGAGAGAHAGAGAAAAAVPAASAGADTVAAAAPRAAPATAAAAADTRALVAVEAAGLGGVD